MSPPDDHARAYLLFDPAELQYDFGERHPLQPRRLVALMSLLESSGLWKQSNDAYQLPLRAATKDVDQHIVRQFFNHVMQKPGFIRW